MVSSLLGGALLLLAEAVSPMPPDTLMLLTEENFPYSFSDPETGLPTGSTVEATRQLMAAAGLGYEIQVWPWKRVMREAAEKPNTCAIGMVRNAEREALYLWVTPMVRNALYFFKVPGRALVLDSLDDAKAYTIATTAGFAVKKPLQAQGFTKFVTSAGKEATLRLLLHGRVDLIVASERSASALASGAGLPVPEKALFWRYSESGLGCSLSSNPALIDRLNAALSDINANQTPTDAGPDQ